MKQHKRQFITTALSNKALCFGEFTLKSGRLSPYFFNAGRIASGKAIAELGLCYAQALSDAGIEFDMLFGPAYKGIPLATTTAVALSEKFGQDVPLCFNRKEAKDHGEGGNLIGAPLSGRVVIIDDVITAGTAIREALATIHKAGAEVAAVVVGLDRQERGQGKRSAIEELENETGLKVISIVQLDDIIDYLENEGDADTLQKVRQYRNTYGV